MTFISASDEDLTSPASPYQHFSEQQWAQYQAPVKLSLNETELKQLCGFNENLSLSQVKNIYLPLCQLLNLHVAASQQLHETSSTFLGSQVAKVPYIIGISGSVAVGKSTTSRILQALLSRWPNHPRVDLITTDGFLYSNAELETRNLMERKGFPESFKLKQMIDLLIAIKSGEQRLQVPLYSHELYDIVPNGFQFVSQPDIVIIEGLNLLNTTPLDPKGQPALFVSDFLDFSIYVDAQTAIIEKWYLERFLAFREQARQHPERYFHRFSLMSEMTAYGYARQVWRTINQANLEQNILPFKYRARLILSKEADHSIRSVAVRRL